MFDINSKVVCINDTFIDGIEQYYSALPVKGKIYTVRDLVGGQDFKLNPTLGVLLVELVNKPNKHNIEPAFAYNRFRELEENEDYETKEEKELISISH